MRRWKGGKARGEGAKRGGCGGNEVLGSSCSAFLSLLIHLNNLEGERPCY